MRQILQFLVTIFLGKRLVMAYIDPNSGGMLFQALAVGLGLLSGFLLFFSGQIKGAWARLVRRQRERGQRVSVAVSDDAEGWDEYSQDEPTTE